MSCDRGHRNALVGDANPKHLTEGAEKGARVTRPLCPPWWLRAWTQYSVRGKGGQHTPV